MSIATALTALHSDVENARNKIAEMGGTVTPNGGTSQLSADIATIPQGGGDVTVVPLTATENGTYTAPDGVAYSPVTVNVQGGGGLPLGITEMESGQFTVPSDTQGRMTIQFTNFTSAPTHVVVWTKSIAPAANVIKNILYDANGIQYNDQITMRYNAAGTGLQALMSYAFNPSAAGIQVGENSGYVWQGGVVYYWMAWR